MQARPSRIVQQIADDNLVLALGRENAESVDQAVKLPLDR